MNWLLYIGALLIASIVFHMLFYMVFDRLSGRKKAVVGKIEKFVRRYFLGDFLFVFVVILFFVITFIFG